MPVQAARGTIFSRGSVAGDVEHTKPELIVRRVAHRLGYRFRLHRRDLPGTPDLSRVFRSEIDRIGALPCNAQRSDEALVEKIFQSQVISMSAVATRPINNSTFATAQFDGRFGG
jgi:hypothetical protein